MLRLFIGKYQKDLLFIFFFLLAFSIHSQVYYSTRPDYIRNKTESNNLLSVFRNSYPDTSINELSHFFPRNLLGNIGMPSAALLLNYGTDDMGFRFFEPPTANDRFLEKDISYFRSRGPYAGLTGIAGSKQLQIFKMLFTHTYHDKVNVTVRFNRYTSKGFYYRQQTYSNNLFVTSNYATINKRFGYYLFILNNSNKNDENGGIRDGSITDSTIQINKELLDVRILAANRDNRETKLMFNPWVRINKRKDSLHTSDHYLQLKSKVGFNSYRYKDVNSSSDGFYNAVLLDTVTTRDSSNLRKFTNEMAYSVLTRNNKFCISAGYRNEINSLWQGARSIYMNDILFADAVMRTAIKQDTSKKKDIHAEVAVNAQYVLTGYNGGDKKLEGRSRIVFNEKKKRMLYLNALYETRRPDFIYNKWSANHFAWNNNFLPQQQVHANGGFNLNRDLGLSFLYQELKEYVYFNEEATPAQHHHRIRNLSFSVFAQKILFRHLGLFVNYTRQLTSHTMLIRIPQDAVTARLFYHGNLFKNSLQLQLGVQAQQYAPHTSYAYMPATQIFYLQNTFKTSDYPYVDAYLNARIRPVSFFLKVENVLHGFMGTEYALIPGYYQPDRAFRLGITWMFFD